MSEDIKIEIGKRIREERERIGLTREQVCDTEEELTVKQLSSVAHYQLLSNCSISVINWEFPSTIC